MIIDDLGNLDSGLSFQSWKLLTGTSLLEPGPTLIIPIFFLFFSAAPPFFFLIPFKLVGTILCLIEKRSNNFAKTHHFQWIGCCCCFSVLNFSVSTFVVWNWIIVSFEIKPHVHTCVRSIKSPIFNSNTFFPRQLSRLSCAKSESSSHSNTSVFFPLEMLIGFCVPTVFDA